MPLHLINCSAFSFSWLFVFFVATLPGPATAAEPRGWNSRGWSPTGPSMATRTICRSSMRPSRRSCRSGFYGAHFWSLAHTPDYKGYPAHFPVQGLNECGAWFEEMNRQLHERNIKVVGHFNVEFLVGDPDGPKGPDRLLQVLSRPVGREGARPEAGRRSAPAAGARTRRQADHARRLRHRRHERVLGLPQQSRTGRPC